MTTELQVSSPSMFDMAPAEMMAHIGSIATVLRDVIKKQNLAVNIQGRHYVKVDGWAAMGSLLGFLPREVSVVELPDGSYEAKVELYSVKTGKVVGQGSALCGIDEKRWGGADRYARRSMAITRATGKAYRLGLSWVVAMAGYESTPYEEMPREMEEATYEPPRPAKRQEQPKPAATKKASVYDGSDDQVAIVERILTNKGIPQDRWIGIHEKLLGRPSTDINQVILEASRS
jgi:hypothetical protein